MKKRLSIMSSSMIVAVLFAMLFQSFHSLEHMSQLLSEKHCDHKYATDKNEISHAHHSFDHCFGCEFTLSPSIVTDLQTFELKAPVCHSKLSLVSTEKITLTFTGSLLTLRGPPSV